MTDEEAREPEPLADDQLALIERNRWHAPPTWVRALVAEVRLARTADGDYEHDKGYYVERWMEAESERDAALDKLRVAL